MSKMLERFHGRLDLFADPQIVVKIPTEPRAIVVVKQVTIQDRELRYRFSTHFHPFVPHLIQSLVAGSVPGLEAQDTNYQHAEGGGAFKPMPGSLRLTLPAEFQFTLADGRQLKLGGASLAR